MSSREFYIFQIIKLKIKQIKSQDSILQIYFFWEGQHSSISDYNTTISSLTFIANAAYKLREIIVMNV